MKMMQQFRQAGAYVVNECQISRAYADEVCVMLPCGYRQRFFTVEKSDEQHIATCQQMKKAGVATASFAFDFQVAVSVPF